MSQIIDFCRAIVLNGGATYLPSTGELNPTRGYAVGLVGTTYLTAHPVKECVMQFMKMYLDETMEHAIGGWIKDDLLYLDVVQIVYDLQEAVDLGKKCHQKAIYDLSAQKDIYIHGNAHTN